MRRRARLRLGDRQQALVDAAARHGPDRVAGPPVRLVRQVAVGAVDRAPVHGNRIIPQARRDANGIECRPAAVGQRDVDGFALVDTGLAGIRARLEELHGVAAARQHDREQGADRAAAGDDAFSPCAH